MVIEKSLHGMVNHVLPASHTPELKTMVPCVDQIDVLLNKLFHGLVAVLHVKMDSSQMKILRLV